MAGKTNPQNMYLFIVKLMTTPSREEGVQYGHLSIKWLFGAFDGECGDGSQQWFLLLAGWSFGHSIS